MNSTNDNEFMILTKNGLHFITIKGEGKKINITKD
jgi:hypothetical protein